MVVVPQLKHYCPDGLHHSSLGIKSMLIMMMVLVLECYPVPEEDLLERCVRVGEVFGHRANRGIVHQLVWGGGGGQSCNRDIL